MDRYELQKLFLAESDELVTDLEQGLVALESGTADDDAIHRVFRAAHTLKSNAGMLGLDAMVSFAHVAENLLDRVRSGTLPVSNDLVSLLLSSVDVLKLHVAGVASGRPVEESADHKRLLAELQKFSNHVAIPERKPTPSRVDASGTKVFSISITLRADAFERGQDPTLLLLELEELGTLLENSVSLEGLPPLSQLQVTRCYLSWRVVLETSAAKDAVASVFVFVADEHSVVIDDITKTYRPSLARAEKRIGELLVDEGLVSERAVSEVLGQHRRVGELLVETGKVDKEDLERVLEKQSLARRELRATSIRVETSKLDALVNLVGELVICLAQVNQSARNPAAEIDARVAAVESLDRIGRDLQSQIMAVRMVPVDEMFQRFKRTVRDVATQQGKHVVLETFGVDTELDKNVIEQLADPLKHMVRNCVAHGIEMPEERIAAGKSDTGHVRLRAKQQQGHILLEVSDDGRGIDAERVLKKARSLGLVAPNEVLTEKQVHGLLFRPGFSTAAEVDEISGRGVGLDVVRANVEALRGTVEVSSVLGQGTTFRISLPLTLAIIDGMNVRVGPETLTIPLLSVVELISPRKGQMAKFEGASRLVEVRGEYLPTVSLAEVLLYSHDRKDINDPIVVILESQGRKFGVVVDCVLGMEQAVIKPLDRSFQFVGALDATFKRPEAIAGATILGDGTVGLIIDVQGVERMAFGAAA